MSREQIHLSTVLNVSEVCVLWRKQRKTVMLAIANGHLVARQSKEGGAWFIHVASVVKRWGMPDADKWNDLLHSASVAGLGLKGD